MKIAYLMQCHKSPQQINLLVDMLSGDNCDVYIHIDKKSKNLETDLINLPNVFILGEEERVDVKWGQISQVDATLKLIEAVLKTGCEYDYVWLISGQDMPLKSHEQICKYISDSNGAAFMDVLDTSSRRYKRLLKRNEVYTAQWSIKKGFFYRIIRNAWYILTGGRYHTFKVFRRKIDNDKFYFGSSWWCLPYDAVKQINDYLNGNADFYKFFSRCHCPDESFFQTVLLNHTTYRENVKPMPIYVNWGEDNNSPEIFVMDDREKIDKLIESNQYLIARKFDYTIDKDIIDYVKNFSLKV